VLHPATLNLDDFVENFLPRPRGLANASSWAEVRVLVLISCHAPAFWKFSSLLEPPKVHLHQSNDRWRADAFNFWSHLIKSRRFARPTKVNLRRSIEWRCRLRLLIFWMRNLFNQKPKAHNTDEGWLLPTQLFVNNIIEIYSQQQAKNTRGYGPQAMSM
jgi:hypothetical protein